MHVIWNTTKDEHKNKLQELFHDAIGFDCAVAFAKMSGFRNIRKHLEAALRNGMSARFILGLDFYITDPDALDALLRLTTKFNVKTYVSKPQSNICFHPKVYLFYYKSYTILVAGSANLTGGGFGGNWECSLLVRQQKNDEISGHLQALIDDGEVDELTPAILADYKRKHRIARAVHSANERQVARLTKSGAQTLEPLEAIVRELKLDHSPFGLESMSLARAASIKEARSVIASLRRERPQTEVRLLPDIHALRKCFHSGGLQRHISKIVKQPTEFLQLLDLACAVNADTESPEHAYERLRPVANNIRGLGPNWVSEILHALEPSKYAILNQNSVAGMALAGIEFPAKPNKISISGDIYGKFCQSCSNLKNAFDLRNLSELDLVFDYAYWNYEDDEE